MKKFLIVIVCFVGIPMSAMAQYEFSIQGAFEKPTDKLKSVFKPGTGVVATFSKTKRYKNKGSAMGVSIGYSTFVPKQDIFRYTVDNSGDGSIRYDKMSVYQLSLQLRRDYIIDKKLDLFTGFELGLHYTKTGYEQHDPNHSTSSNSFVARVALAPKAGVNFQLTDHVGVFFQTRYLVSIGRLDFEDAVVNTFWTNSLGLNFRF
jgi:hypothetical protein